MTLPSGGAINIAQIYGEAQISSSSPWFNRGTNLGSYRGVQWWLDNTQTGTFPTGTISMSDFYSKRSTTPVSPGSAGWGSPGVYYFQIPLYSTLYVLVRGGSGGGAGQSGNAAAGGAGGAGGDSYIAAVLGASGGRGAPPGGTGSAGAGSDGTPAGGAGYGAGGAGGKADAYFSNPISGGSGPAVGSTVTIVVGGGGGGGGGGAYWVQYPTWAAGLPGGSSGSAGSVQIWWY